ncbi:beta-phosphoglucomutase [Chryseolinea sp. T2]|uniref:beta-phosphoglucomutase n=1 Tax=Chryseolinea sp. T2 TaxID=3129255 RepID=UPI003076A475
MIRACIFDLDGVIVDTARYHFLAWSRLAGELGIPFTERDNERLKGVSRMRSLEILLSLGKNKTYSDSEIEALAARKNEWFVEYIDRMDRSEIFPGVEKLIADLKHRGILVGLASSSKNAPQVIQSLGIADEFDVVVDGGMVKHAKPDPEIFLLAASLLKISSHDCVVFEDAAAGIDAAIAAGMKSVGIGSSELLGHANIVVSRTGDFDPEELKKL